MASNTIVRQFQQQKKHVARRKNKEVLFNTATTTSSVGARKEQEKKTTRKRKAVRQEFIWKTVDYSEEGETKLSPGKRAAFEHIMVII